MLDRIRSQIAALISPPGEQKTATVWGATDWRGNWHGAGGLNWNFWQQGLNLQTRPDAIGTAYACIDATSTAIASMPVQHNKQDSVGAQTKVTTSALSRVLIQPNKHQIAFDLFNQAMRLILIDGACLIVVTARNDREEIVSLAVLPQDAFDVQYVEGDDDYFYAVAQPNGELFYIPESEAAFLCPCPDKKRPFRGISPITAAALSMDLNLTANVMQNSFLRNGSKPSGVLSTKERIDADTAAQLRARFIEQTKGDTGAGNVVFLANDFKYESTALNAVDAQLIESLRFSDAQIMRAFRTPAPVLGSSDGSSQFGTVDALLRAWHQLALRPYIELFERKLERLFKLPPHKQSVEFQTESLLRLNFADRVKALADSVNSGLLTCNEARGRLGLGSLDGGDILRVSVQSQPAVEPDPIIEIVEPPAPVVEPGEPIENQLRMAIIEARRRIERGEQLQ